MTIGKKIGGGFCAVILLTLILGAWAIRAMDEGANISALIADDRLPRLMAWTQAQNDLLEGAYYARVYFESGSEEALPKAFDYLKLLKEQFAVIKQLNAKNHYENTAKAIEKGERDLAAYVEMIRANQNIYEQGETLMQSMMRSAERSMKHFEELIMAMSKTQQDFIKSGNTDAALQYSRNLASASSIYARVTKVLEELLWAERNNDLELFAKVQSQLPVIAQDAKAIDQYLQRRECHALLADTIDEYNKFANDAQQVAATLSQNLDRGKQRYLHFQAMHTDTVKMVELTMNNTNKFVREAANNLSGSTTGVSILLGIVSVLGIIVAITITRIIVRPLAATQLYAQDVAAGNMDRELEVHTKDETGKLADALRSMVRALKANIAEAHTNSEEAQRATKEAHLAMAKAEEAARQAENAKREGMLAAATQLEGMVEIISSASTQLSAQIEQSDRGASESAQRLQEAATAMNEMNATVQEVARNAGSASGASSETKEKAEAGAHVVRQVVQSIGEVQQVSLQLKSDMAQLNERAQDINRIMGVISDIADQTNLLALNAAIEAARAGEAGRGFAVVADEVRKLAEKTMTSTLDVSNAIRAIQESTDKSMDAVDNAVRRIGEATELANQSGAALGEIVATVDTTSDQVQAIAAASEEQSAASEEINRSIIEVNDMSRLTADAMAEANNAVGDLTNEVHKLTDLIRQMKNA